MNGEIWHDLVFVVTVAAAVGAIIWTLRDRLASRDEAFEAKIDGLGEALLEKIEAIATAATEGRAALADKIRDMKDELTENITASRHEIRKEMITRFTRIDEDVSNLKVSLAEHRAEDQGWFRNQGERLSRLEAPQQPPTRRGRQ